MLHYSKEDGTIGGVSVEIIKKWRKNRDVLKATFKK